MKYECPKTAALACRGLAQLLTPAASQAASHVDISLTIEGSILVISTYAIHDNLVTLYLPDSQSAISPLRIVYLHTTESDGDSVWEQYAQLGYGYFALVAIKPRSWNDDLTPWPCPGIFANDAPFGGNAQAQLKLLEHEIIPTIERDLPKPPDQRLIAGYSLAGLFATWAVFESALFSSVASASGSFWYPGFAQFAHEHTLVSPVACAYFSLGSKEARTPSRLLRNVEQGTQQVTEAFRSKGVKTTFEKNPGNHFKEPALRMAKGIRWVLDQ